MFSRSSNVGITIEINLNPAWKMGYSLSRLICLSAWSQASR